MYRIHITTEPQQLGADTTYRVAVFLPGQSSTATAVLNAHNLEVVLNEILLSPDGVSEHLRKANSRDGALIEVEDLSERHFNMLRGLPPSAMPPRR